ncbi:hypothetical protein N7444_008210 [Penicillium canescens]|nr:hypothetical protein N7444_008210 [Penicillium canescens]
MRANSAKQRFPVLEWTHKLEVLQRTAIHIHHAKNRTTTAGPARSQIYSEMRDEHFSTVALPRLDMSLAEGLDSPPVRTSQLAHPSLQELQAADHLRGTESNRSSILGRKLSLGRRDGPGQGRKRLVKKSLRESQISDQRAESDTTDAEDEGTDTPQEDYISPKRRWQPLTGLLGLRKLVLIETTAATLHAGPRYLPRTRQVLSRGSLLQ